MSNRTKRFRVRFHLGKGKNFMKWQVADWGPNLHKGNLSPHKDYYDPDNCEIVMFRCILGNQPATAQKIFEGANKTVCAWVDCDDIDIHYKKDPNFEPLNEEGMTQYKYNPRKNPHWFTDSDPNVDKTAHKVLATTGKKIYGV
jgi:hypothetical protein|tara:strand:+ start:211 stop:639 length:429 start_codon:yes stop_codon:yes gene_type:complete